MTDPTTVREHANSPPGEEREEEAQPEETLRREIRVSALKEGTVIDHLNVGTALRVLKVIGIPEDKTVAIGLNLESRQLGHKDLIKIERRELSQQEVDKIALLSPNATISIIRNFEVYEKIVPEIPNLF